MLFRACCATFFFSVLIRVIYGPSTTSLQFKASTFTTQLLISSSALVCFSFVVPPAPHDEMRFSSMPPKVGTMFAILVVISVLYPVSNVISALVKEKELRIKEGLKMMGLTNAAHTASWIFHFVCLFFFTSILMVLASGSLFENRCPPLGQNKQVGRELW